MNIHHSQEPPRKRSRDQQHTSSSSGSMVGGGEKGSHAKNDPNSNQTQSSNHPDHHLPAQPRQPQPNLSLPPTPLAPNPTSGPYPASNTGSASNSGHHSGNQPWFLFRRHQRHHNQSGSSSAGSSASTSATSSHSPAAYTSSSSAPNPTGASNPGSSSGSQIPSGAMPPSSSNSSAAQPSLSGALGESSVRPGNIPSFAGVSMDADPEDIEMSRLQAILEARGVPSHLFGALGPRMQTLLHRTIGSSSSSKAHQLVQGLKAHGDEGQQLQTVMEMCQLLVMGNEDTLAGFPVKLAVPNLITLLNMEHNFDIMNHACRALTYMMESLPRSASVVVDAVPSFLEKLQAIQCMDVAEQSLTALEMLSRRHSRAILHARGVSACLTFLDFFSINAQRSALTIAANCCQNINSDEFQYIKDSLVTLSSHLTSSDKKCVESIILAFSRLVEHYQNEPLILKEVASGNLMDNLTQLLLATPSVISMNAFVMIIRMMALMCKSCPELAVRLLSCDIVSTMRYLLVGQKLSSKTQMIHDVGTSNNDSSTGSLNDSSFMTNTTLSNTSISRLNESVELLNRTPQELYEITSLISELMPQLPTNGIFSINSIFDEERNSVDAISWQWRDDRGVWHRYHSNDSKLIDIAHRAGEEEVTLMITGKTYTIDFTTMHQINEETDISRPVQRKVYNTQSNHHTSENKNERSEKTSVDPRIEYIKTNPSQLEHYVHSLFGVLHEIYCSSAGVSVRHKCLSAFLRIVYYSPSDTLRQLLRSHPVSSHIASMLSSSDQKILVGSIQMALILVDKLPEIFSVYFRREGVIHQFKKLAEKTAANPASFPSASTSSNQSNKDELKEWILTQAQTFEKHISENLSGDSHNVAVGVLKKLTCALELLDVDMYEGLSNLKSLLSEGDISSFEFIHSGLVAKMIKFLTYETDGNRDERVRAFLSTFLSLPKDPRHMLLVHNQLELKPDTGPLSTLVMKLNACISQLENFPVRLHDLMGIGSGNTRGASALKFFNNHQLKCNLQRHPSCNSLRQWKGGPVKIDPLAIVQAIEKYLTVRGYAKVRDSADNSDDNSGDDMDDNMTAMMPSSGRHRLQLLIGDHILPYNMTVYQAIRQFAPSVMNANMDMEESDMQMLGNSNMWTDTHTIYYRSHVESIQPGTSNPGPSTRSSVSTAAAYFKRSSRSSAGHSSSSASAGASDLRLNHGNCGTSSSVDAQSSVPMQGLNDSLHSDAGASTSSSCSHQHSQTSSRRYNTRNSSNSLYSSHFPRIPIVRKKADDIWRDGKTTPAQSPADAYLEPKLPQSVTIKDPSLDVIVLLRAIFGLNRHWAWFYKNVISFCTYQILQSSEFINTKLAAKATRQLQDPLVIMTGNLPNWLPQLAYACPFLMPFDTRQLLFYVTSFDRDRALQRLLDSTPELNNSEDRVAPRLERRRKTINRDDMFRQGEIILNELTNSKTVLEIQYENEVGTGLGPTLEFYALFSRELQNAELEMWRGDIVQTSRPSMRLDETRRESAVKHQAKPTESSTKSYAHPSDGLFPIPIPRNGKASSISRLRSRFKLLGKFMAKALMDSRMIDINFSLPFYKWLLSQENSFDLNDMAHIDPTLAKTLFQLHKIAQLYIIRQQVNAVSNANVGQSSKHSSKSSSKLSSRSNATPNQAAAPSLPISDISPGFVDDWYTNIGPEVLTMDGCPIEDLNLDFTLPGYSSIELKKGGKNIVTKLDNLDQYVKLLQCWTLGEGVRRQMESFKAGFESIVPLNHLRIFYPEEMDSLFCGTGYQQWDVRMLMDACKTDHGFTHESIQIKYLFEILSSYNGDEQRKFLQFITGSPRLPFGGLKSLSPQLTIVRKTLEPGQNPDHFLPSVMTCVNYLKLPEYSSCEIMREKLRISGEEGQNAFFLS